MKRHKKSAFTLVELIVVITILAILGTIAFISLQGYSAKSRDSVRISDMSRIKTSLEVFHINSDRYPDPTELQAVTYSGGLAWNQGIFGNSTFINVEKLDKIPRDPLTEKEYTYSLLNTKQEYELVGILEGDNIVNNNIIGKVNAGDKTAVARISGTYNGISLRVNTNGTSYVLALPSIVTSIDLAVELNRRLEVIIPGKELILSHFRNLPSNYINSTYNSNRETTNPNYKPTSNNDISKILVYEGDLNNLTAEILVTKLQEAYSGALKLPQTNQLLGLEVGNVDELEKIDTYGVNFINNNLGGSAEIKIYNTCGGTAHNTILSYYSAESVGFGISCNTIKKDFICKDGIWKDGENTADTGTYQYLTCGVDGALNCTYLATSYNHGDSFPVYSVGTIAWDASENCTDGGIQGSVTCNNGTNDGDNTYGNLTCTKGIPTNCSADGSHVINTHTYNIIQLNHNVGSTPIVDISENNGTFRYTFNALCNDGTITGNETGPVVQSCDTNYSISGNNCVANTQLVSCGGSISSNASQNIGPNYTQTWNGSIWTPTTSWNISQAICDFNCNTNYSWNGSSCIADTQSVSCGGSIPSNASQNIGPNYTQTWNGSIWTPATSWGESQATCDFNCNSNYSWNGSSCEEDTQSTSCGGSIPSNASQNIGPNYTQTWNGSIWAPTTSWGESQATCDFNCNTNYSWNGSSCEPDQLNPTNLSISNTDRRNRLTISFTAGIGVSNNCSIRRVDNGNIITTGIDCNQNYNQTITLSDNTLGSSWGGKYIEIYDPSLSQVIATSSNTMNCSIISSTDVPHPDYDYDCDGIYNESKSCTRNLYSGCPDGGVCAKMKRGSAWGFSTQTAYPTGVYDWTIFGDGYGIDEHENQYILAKCIGSGSSYSNEEKNLYSILGNNSKIVLTSSLDPARSYSYTYDKCINGDIQVGTCDTDGLGYLKWDVQIGSIWCTENYTCYD